MRTQLGGGASRWHRLLAIFLSALAPASSITAGETLRWCDPHLAIRNGLVMWLDASRQGAAAEAAGRAATGDGAALETWFDGSGNRIDLTAQSAAARPRF